MAFSTICTHGFQSGAVTSIASSIIPLAAVSAGFTAVIIALGYMFGEVTHNPKVSLWAKTEIFQLGISIASVILILQLISTFCTLNIADAAKLFGIDAQPASFYRAAELYLVKTITSTNELLQATRYHLGAYNVLETYSEARCHSAGGAANLIFCLFGAGLGGGGIGTGIYLSPGAGYALAASGVNVAFNSQLFSYLSAFNYLLILRFIYSGFAFFFLPLGIFLRSMPFMRTAGSLFITMVLSFVIIYPLVLSFFYIDIGSGNSSFLTRTRLFPDGALAGDALMQYAKKSLENQVDAGTFVSQTFFGDIQNRVFDGSIEKGKPQESKIFAATGKAFLIAVFIPSLAMLASIASLVFVNRFLGEEIDLSRIVQMV